MAAVVREVNAQENGLNNAKQQSVVILDSDEEEEQSTSELFQRFIEAVRPFLERKEILLLRVKFAEIRSDYASCPSFREMLRRKASQVHKTDVYIHFNEVLKKLISNAAMYGINALKRSRDSEVKSIGECSFDASTKSNKDEERDAMAGKFEIDQQDCCKVKSTAQRSRSNQSNMHIDVQIIDLEDPSSLRKCKPQKQPTPKHLPKEDPQRIIRKQSRKKKIMKLERKLENISTEIKRLTQSELSLEEMERADSNYMKESKLKEQFNKIWEKICMLKGRPPDTGRVIEQDIKVKTTNFSTIDRAVKKFLNKRKGFPNIFDIRNIVIRANKKNGLGLTASVIQEIAADVFTDIGNKIQKKRLKDHEYNFGCHLTDDCLSSLDPALNDYDLRKKLDENKKVGQSALDGIFEKYVHLGRIKTQDYQDSTPCNSDYESSDDETYVNKKRKKRDSSDSASSEEKKVKRPKHTEQQTLAITSTATVTDSTNMYGHANKACVIPVSTCETPSCMPLSKHESIEIIIDDDDDDDKDLSVISNQQSIKKESESTFGHQPNIISNGTSGECKSPVSIDKTVKSLSLQKCEKKVLTNDENLTNGINHENCPNLILSDIVKSANFTTKEAESIADTCRSSKPVNKSVLNEDDNKHQPSKEDSLMVMADKSGKCPDTSLIKTNHTSSWKLKVNASKLHLKIQQLKAKKLSDLSITSQGQTCSIDSDMLQSKQDDRKPTVSYQIQEHSSASQSCNVASEKSDHVVDVPSISQHNSISRPNITSVNSSTNTELSLKDCSNHSEAKVPQASSNYGKAKNENMTKTTYFNDKLQSTNLQDLPPVDNASIHSINTEDKLWLSGHSQNFRGSLDTRTEHGHIESQKTQVTTNSGLLPSKQTYKAISSNKCKEKPPLDDIIVVSDDDD